MKKLISISALSFSNSDVKLLNQVWRQEYNDCASIEEVARRLALNGIQRILRIYKSFNFYKKMRESGLSPDEVQQLLKKKKLDGDNAKLLYDEQEKAKAKAEAKAEAEALKKARTEALAKANAKAGSKTK